MSVLSRSDLLIPSLGLSDVVTRGFALLGANTDVIRRSKVPSRKDGHSVLKNFLNGVFLGYEAHESTFSSILYRCLTNILFNNQRKRTTNAMAKDRVAAFKKYLTHELHIPKARCLGNFPVQSAWLFVMGLLIYV